MRLKIIFSLAAALFALTACGGAAKLDSAQNDFAAGRYDRLAADSNSNNLDILIGAQGAFQAGEYAQSDSLFEAFNHRNIDPTSTSFLGEAGQLAAGRMATDYKPYMMDYLFVSYYQIWDAMLRGRWADARVIINQSYNRQQKMSQEYNKLISKRQGSSSLPSELQSNLVHWNAYSDIMNPALTYLSGLYFLNAGEHENARQYLARAAGMLPGNEYVRMDLHAAEGGKTPDNMVWIFIETGFAPRLQEKKISFPWPVGDGMQVISVAMSYPVRERGAARPQGSQLLADTDAMFMTEYGEYQINEALRSAAKAASNYAIQAVSQDQLGGWGGVLGAAYAIATTNAEIRTWATLPQSVYLIRVARSKSGLIKLNSGANLELKEPGNYVVHVRGNDVKTVKIK
jgi:hypothetical protein